MTYRCHITKDQKFGPVSEKLHVMYWKLKTFNHTTMWSDAVCFFLFWSIGKYEKKIFFWWHFFLSFSWLSGLFFIVLNYCDIFQCNFVGTQQNFHSLFCSFESPSGYQTSNSLSCLQKQLFSASPKSSFSTFSSFLQV